jgi:superfamily II DNA or RNA helicase
MNISDFLPSYPDFDEDVEEILGSELVNKSSSASFDIYKKKEFFDHRLKKFEEKPNKPGEYMDHQTIVTRFMSNHTQYDELLLFWDPGCLDPETPVLLYDGTIKCAKEIKVGDQLVGDDGNPRTVLQLVSGVDQMYEIKQEYSDSYIVNSNHVLSVIDSMGEIKDIKVSEYINLPITVQNGLKGVKLDKAMIWPSKKVVDPYIFGSKLAYDLIDVVPMNYVINDTDTRIKVLAGLINACGDICQDGIEIRQKKMSKTILFIARSLGLSAYEGNNKINISGKLKDIPTIIKCPNTNTLYSKIEVTPLKVGEYCGWNLDGNKRFLLGDFTVTHNSGKTCGSVSIIESILRGRNSAFNGAVVLMKGLGLVNNYKNELVNFCTDGIYKPDEYDTELEKIRRTNKKIEEYYDFNTFEMFSKLVGKMTDKTIQEKYNNKIIVIDEVHNLRISDERSQYYSIHRFLHVVKNCKILMMSGTPMRDQPQEIAAIMNLILPVDKQLPVEKAFSEQFLIKQGDSMVVKPNMSKSLGKYFNGRVSYVRSMQSDVKRTFMGEKIINYFNLYTVEPTQFQTEIYKHAYDMDVEVGVGITKKGKGVYSNSSQVSLFAYPNGSWGESGFKKYIKVHEGKEFVVKGGKRMSKITYSLTDELRKLLSGKNTDETLKNIRKYSAIYADCIEKILNNNDKAQFAYIEFVGGCGAILFSKLLELFGFRQAIGGENTEAKRYALITGKSSKTEITKILNTQNDPKNVNGKYIRVVIGSQVIGEGFSLKNIQLEYILTPHWNFSETDQAIARGLRLFSHKDLEKLGVQINVEIYLYCLGISPIQDSINYKMYKTSEDKDISIKSIEHIMRETSFDCPLNRERNILPPLFDYMRECDYKKCDYQCEDMDEKMYDEVDIDLSTYNLFYEQKELKVAVDQIKKLLLVKPYIKLSELLRTIPTSDFIIFKAIDRLISGEDSVSDRLGYNCLVKYTGDFIYLTYNLTNNGNFFDNFYVENFPLREYPQFSKEAEVIYSQNLPNVFDRMKNESDPEKRTDLLQGKFSIEAKELMLELALKSLKSNEKIDDDGVRDFIIDNFKPYLKKINDTTTVSTLLPEELRCFDEKINTWSDCDEKYKGEIDILLKDEKGSLETNQYGYYGIVETDTGKFSIRDMTKFNLVGGDKRKIPQGKVCNPSWDIKELLKLVDIMKFEYDDENYRGKTKDELITYRNKDGYKDAKASFSLEELEKKSEDDIMRILYWAKNKKKKSICERIKKWFEEQNLIEIVSSKK